MENKSENREEARVYEIGDTPTMSRQNSQGMTGGVSLVGQAHGHSRSVIQPFDPARIPASVFGAKSSTPMEWSFASNESLFSIHVGNTSFSKDHMFRSGELTKFDQELARFSGVVSTDQITDGIRTPSDVSKDRFDWTYNAAAHPFQFPVLVGNYDNGMMSSPKMEPRRNKAVDKWNSSSPAQPASPAQSKQTEHDNSNWMFCLTCCFKPCR